MFHTLANNRLCNMFQNLPLTSLCAASCLGYTPRTSGGEVAARERCVRFKTEYLNRWDASHW
jgi:hypothetical protein